MNIPAWWDCPEGFEELQKLAHLLGEKELTPAGRHSESGRPISAGKPEQGSPRSGYGAVTIPVEAGGLKQGFTAFSVLAESFAQYCPSSAMCWVMHTTSVHTLYEAGTEEQRKRYIPGVLKGDIAALAFSEPATGGHF